jgi:hypothetical protein
MGTVIFTNFQPSNLQRAAWAEQGLQAFADQVHMSLNDELEDIVADFLSDLMHFCDARNLDFNALLLRAADYYDSEVKEDK